MTDSDASSLSKRGAHERTGRSGEYYVVAELNRRGCYAVPFAGNMPEIDIMATNAGRTRTVYIQVKTKRTGRTKRHGRPTGNWHSRASEGDKDPRPEHFWAFVSIPNDYNEPPSFWVVRDAWLRQDIKANHAAWLERTGGRRPRGNISDHHGISEDRLKEWEDNWDILEIF